MSQPTHMTHDEIRVLAATSIEEAMTAVRERYHAKLVDHSHGITKDRIESEKIVEEVYHRARHERRFFNDDFDMSRWLYRVTGNLSQNWVSEQNKINARP